jgi:hypothetical protein
MSQPDGKTVRSSFPYKLRDLPLAARLTLSVFLMSVGVGYFSALIQLHVQQAPPGQLLPTSADTRRLFHPEPLPRPISKMEILLEADPSLPATGSGQMRFGFTHKADKDAENRAAAARRRGGGDVDALTAKFLAEVLQEREGERQAVLAWLQSGASEDDYNDDSFCLPDDLRTQPITRAYLVSGSDKPDEPRKVKLQSLLHARCIRCHSATEGEGNAVNFPMDSFDQIQKYATAKSAESPVMPLNKLAQTTHAHLLSFSVLFGLTGLIFAFSGYPRLVRAIVSPLPLVAQVIEIACWWLPRMAVPFAGEIADAIPKIGMVVGIGVALQILGGLFGMYRWKGQIVLLLMMLGAAAGLVWLAPQVNQYLEQEKAPSASSQ